MNAKNDSATSISDRELVFTRLFDAPRALVRKAWTEPERIVHWWGPDGFTNTSLEMDVRPGGRWRFVMHGSDGVDYDNRMDYREVVPQERLSYSHGSDVDVDPARFDVTMTFADQGGKTLLTMRSLFPTAADRDKVVKEFGAIDGATRHCAASPGSRPVVRHNNGERAAGAAGRCRFGASPIVVLS